MNEADEDTDYDSSSSDDVEIIDRIDISPEPPVLQELQADVCLTRPTMNYAVVISEPLITPVPLSLTCGQISSLSSAALTPTKSDE